MAEFCDRNQGVEDLFHSMLQEGNITNTRMIHWIWQVGNDYLKARKELGVRAGERKGKNINERCSR